MAQYFNRFLGWGDCNYSDQVNMVKRIVLGREPVNPVIVRGARRRSAGITVTPYHLHYCLRQTLRFRRCRSTSFARTYGASKTPLECQKLLIVHQWSPDALTFHQGSFQFGVRLHGQVLSKIFYTIKQRTHCNQTIVLSAKVRWRAGPGPISRRLCQLCFNWVQSHVTECRHQVGLVHRYTAESPLKQVAGNPQSRVDIPAVSTMGFSHCSRQPRVVRRNKDQVDMIRHKAI